ncbi:MAG: pentapeptide repeat-containing protein [Cyanobacteria bacterium J06554_11]
MVTTDFLSLVEQGAVAWNQWRIHHADIQPNLSRAYLYGADLRGYNLSNVNLERACLIGANLAQANLSGARLRAAYASSAIFREADLSRADLQQGSFSEADFTKADLSAVKGGGAGFAGACLTGACLATWQIDRTTVLANLRGEYVYLSRPPAGRWPQSGLCQPGALTRWLQRQQGRGRQTLWSQLNQKALSIWHRLRPILQKSLRRFRWVSLRIYRAGLRRLHQLLSWLWQVALPTAKRQVGRRSQQTWVAFRRLLRVFQVHSLRKGRQLKRQLHSAAQALAAIIQPRWQRFLRGESPLQQTLTTAHQNLNVAGQNASLFLRVEGSRRSAPLRTGALTSGRRLRTSLKLGRRRWQRARRLKSLPATFIRSVWHLVWRRPLVSAASAAGIAAFTMLDITLPSDDSFTDEPDLTQTSTALPSSAPPSSAQYLAKLSKVGSPDPAPSQVSGLPTVSHRSVEAVELPCPAAEIPALDSLKADNGYRYQDGTIFYGSVEKGQPATGKGTMLYPTGNRYDGDYESGRRNGCGTFTYSNGRRYVGQFVADQFNGQGTWILENGERYIGEFKDNQCHGQGIFVFANGSVESGTWQQGQLIGGEISCQQGSLRVPTSSDN